MISPAMDIMIIASVVFAMASAAIHELARVSRKVSALTRERSARR
jgi:hypothetical protein